MASRRAGLTQTDFVQATVAFLATRGIDELTMRRLGEELGVDATALYRHFPGKDSLLDAAVDWMLGEVADRIDTSIEDPRAYLVHLTETTREVFSRHPRLGLALMSGVGDIRPNGIRFMRLAIDGLRRLGVSGRDLVVSYQALESFVLGSCIQDFLGAPANFEIRRARYRTLEDADFDAGSTTAGEVEEIARNAFRLGVELVLDRCEELAASRTR